MKFQWITGLLAAACLSAPLQTPALAPDRGDTLRVIVELEERVDAETGRSLLRRCDADAVYYGAYDVVLHGFAAEIDETGARLLERMPEVAALRLSCDYTPCATGDVADDAALVNLNDGGTYQGEGMVVAVLDTGFDVTHEAFSLSDASRAALTQSDIDALVASESLSFSSYYTGGKGKGASPYISAKIPYAFDYAGLDGDVSGSELHGTHVAGIIASNNDAHTRLGFDGVAPQAQLLLMKILNDERGVISDYAVLYALEDAVRLGADVINLSFGAINGEENTSFRGFDYTRAIDAAEEAGIIVVGAAGNNGFLGEGSSFDRSEGIALPLAQNPDYGLISSPSSFRNVLSAASASRGVYAISDYIQLPDESYLLYSLPDELNGFKTIRSKTLEYVLIGGTGAPEDYESVNVRGKIAVVERGVLPFSEKVLNAQNAGAAGVIIYNSDGQSDLVSMKLSDNGITIPALFVSAQSGDALKAARPKKMTFVSRDRTLVPYPETGMSSFSSWGGTASLALKPDITAYGAAIYSAVNTGSGYGALSGTSMAAPYLSGAAALVRQMLRETGEDDANTYTVRRLLMGSAVPLTDPSGVEYSPRRQGAGLCDIRAALQCPALAYGATSLPKIELGDGLGQQFELRFNLRNNTGERQTFTLSVSALHDKWISSGGRWFVTGESEPFADASVTLRGSDGEELNRYGDTQGVTVTLAPYAYDTFTLCVRLDDASFRECRRISGGSGFYVEGFIYAEQDGAVLSLPYMGFAGDWEALPVLCGTPNDTSEFYPAAATTSIASGSGEIETSLGVNAFLEGDAVNASLLAISPDGDHRGDSLSLTLLPLRGASSYSCAIYDEPGALCRSIGGGPLVKCYAETSDAGESILQGLRLDDFWDGGDDAGAGYILPDGRYTVCFTILPSAGMQEQEWSFSVLLDTVDPVLEEAYLTRGTDGRLLLHVRVSDDASCVQYVCAYLGSGQLGEAYAPAALDASAQAEVVIDITDAEQEPYFYLDIVDFAFNASTLRLALSDLELRK